MMNLAFFSRRLIRNFPNALDLVRMFTTEQNSLLKLELTLRKSSVMGSRKSRVLREEGKTPCNVYGFDDDRNILNINCTIPTKALEKELRQHGKSFENTLYELTIVDDTPEKKQIAKYIVTPRQAQFNSLTRKVMTVNFLRYKPGNRIFLPVEIVNTELSEAAKRGCGFVMVNSLIPVVCGWEIPPLLKLDLSKAQKDQIYRINSIVFPPNVRPYKDVPFDLVICSVKSFN